MRVCENPKCQNELPPSSPTGRPRRFCSDACRQAAARILSDEPVYLSAVTAKPCPDEEVVFWVMALRGDEAVGMRLARQSRPSLQWKCRDIAETISAKLAEHFPGAEQ